MVDDVYAKAKDWISRTHSSSFQGTLVEIFVTGCKSMMQLATKRHFLFVCAR